MLDESVGTFGTPRNHLESLVGDAALARERCAVAVSGIVQGVGFRPFVYSLAARCDLSGSVRNDSAGVSIEVEGTPDDVALFLKALRDEAPPLAVIENIAWEALPVRGQEGFRIEESHGVGGRQTLVSPDVATCADCLVELFDPADRRYRYPFINCTNCGPRFTITRDVPYDRASTTMAGFPMCPACRAEYEEPANRRFHAQPNACPRCGPRVQLVDRSGAPVCGVDVDAVMRAAALVREGAILAIKGLGGYHLACNPFDSQAVSALRRRKVRYDKPFALMARDLEQVRTLCHLHADEEMLLTSAARPIALLRRREDGTLAEDVAPRQQSLGVMLAYTPLHHVLLRDAGLPLVMTSGNRHDEPIAYRDDEVFDRLAGLADYFLIHNRPIHMRCDDSVTRIVNGSPSPLRRSRGYAPAPLRLGERARRHVLACGGELKNSFCLLRQNHAFVSHHIGDLENYPTLQSFREGIAHYCRLFDVQPAVVAYDLHPEYLSTKYARELEEEGLPAFGVQHHHAHIASCLADNGRPVTERVIGVALDGTGYGTDGTIWGGEFFEGSLEGGFIRRAHLECAPLPGGVAAIRHPWRSAIGRLIALYGEAEVLRLPLDLVTRTGERNVRLIAGMMKAGLNTPSTSSAGRLFDTVAALLGVHGSDETRYEGQAAIELEAIATSLTHRIYPFRLRRQGDLEIVQTGAIIAAIVDDLQGGRSRGEIASAFHATIAAIVRDLCRRLQEQNGVQSVALSGGTFQNVVLLEKTTALLERDGFTVFRHHGVPANDGGISLGQAVLADRLWKDHDG